ncbi:phosphotransferase family protein [Actinacidiphila polyblastidii]|uniref:phosphotransferase family protein n=1 Tax=Actinacidiphila polyblastidii TaxID=3110430 RepID=UPI0039BD0FBD
MARLAAIASAADAAARTPAGVTHPAPPGARSAQAAPPDGGHVVLAERSDATVVRVGDTVAKAHPADTVAADLAVRLEVATHPSLRSILLPPHPVRTQVQGRPVTVWPYGAPVDAGDAGAAPWEEAAGLLARLHAAPYDALPGPLPAMRGPAKAAAAVARLDGVPDSAATATVRRAWRLLPGWATGAEPYEGRRALCHGDWHLGQLVRHPAPGGRWLLIDVDDLGAGDPAWDLARPAMWFAAGLLAPRTWTRFLAAYRAAGGTAVPPEGDPWDRLDVPARALAVQTAAVAVAKAAGQGRDLDEAEAGVLAACARIAGLSR